MKNFKKVSLYTENMPITTSNNTTPSSGLENVKNTLPVYAITFNDKGELEHQRFSIEYAGEIITKLSKKVNEFETFIDDFNKNHR